MSGSCEKKKEKNFSLAKFGKLISERSKVQVVIIDGEDDLRKYFRKNLIKNEIVIGMGAGSISTWIRNLIKFL